MVTAKAWFNVFVEEDYDLPVTELLHVEVGTVRFNVTGYQAMETRTAETDGKKVVWQGDTIITYMELVDPHDHNKAAMDWNTALQMQECYFLQQRGQLGYYNFAVRSGWLPYTYCLASILGQRELRSSAFIFAQIGRISLRCVPTKSYDFSDPRRLLITVSTLTC